MSKSMYEYLGEQWKKPDLSYNSPQQQMTYSLGHEVGHMNIFPLETALLLVAGYAYFKDKIKLRPLIGGIITYHIFLDEFAADLSKTMFHKFDIANNFFNNMYKILDKLVF